MRRCTGAQVGHDMLLTCSRWDVASLGSAHQSAERLQERGGREVTAHHYLCHRRGRAQGRHRGPHGRGLL